MSKFPKLFVPQRSSKLISKLFSYVTKYSSEFVHTNTTLLWCKICNKKVSFDKKMELRDITKPTNTKIILYYHLYLK